MTLEKQAEVKAKVAEKWGLPDSTVVGAAAAKAPEEVIPESNASTRKTVTNWRAFYEAKVKPTYIKCDGYFPLHPFNSGCHTTLQLKPEQLAAHLDGDHGGGFFFSFREGYQNDQIGASRVVTDRAWDGWLEFEKLGLELRDIRCDVCDEEIKVNSRSILRHLKPHVGKSSRMRPGGDFWLTLSRDATSDIENDEE